MPPIITSCLRSAHSRGFASCPDQFCLPHCSKFKGLHDARIKLCAWPRILLREGPRPIHYIEVMFFHTSSAPDQSPGMAIPSQICGKFYVKFFFSIFFSGCASMTRMFSALHLVPRFLSIPNLRPLQEPPSVHTTGGIMSCLSVHSAEK